MSAAEWKPDPSGRHQLRYFDGSVWTEHVSDHGQQGIDNHPLPVGGTSPTSATTTAMQPTGKVVLWEGKKESMSAAATGGRVVGARYRLTEDALVFSAGLLSTHEEIIPLWAVMDVDLKQSMSQKVRDVADLVVRLDPAGAKYGQTSVRIESIRDARSVRETLSHQANLMRRAMLDHHHDREVEKRQASANSINVTSGVEARDRASTAAPDPSGPISATPSQPDADQVIEQIRKLGELRDSGLLTDAEFESKKSEMLGRL